MDVIRFTFPRSDLVCHHMLSLLCATLVIKALLPNSYCLLPNSCRHAESFTHKLPIVSSVMREQCPRCSCHFVG